jgi:hypothetical protein
MITIFLAFLGGQAAAGGSAGGAIFLCLLAYLFLPTRGT